MKILSDAMAFPGSDADMYSRAVALTMHNIQAMALRDELTIRWDTFTLSIEQVVNGIDVRGFADKEARVEEYKMTELRARVEADE